MKAFMIISVLLLFDLHYGSTLSNYQEIPEAPSLPDLDYNTLPEFIRKYLPTEKPNAPTEVNRDRASRKSERKGPKTYGMMLNNDHGVVWNDMASPNVAYFMGDNENTGQEQRDVDDVIDDLVNKIENKATATPTTIKYESTTIRTKATTKSEPLHYFTTTAMPRTTEKAEQDEKNLLQEIESKLENMMKDYTKVSQVETKNNEFIDIIGTNNQDKKQSRGFNINKTSKSIPAPVNIKHESNTETTRTTKSEPLHFTTAKPKTTAKPEQIDENNLLYAIESKLDNIIKGVTDFAKTSQVEKQGSEIEDVISTNSKHHERGRLGLNINNVKSKAISTPIKIKHESATKIIKATTPESLHYFTTAKPQTTEKPKQVDESDLLYAIESKLNNIIKGVTDFAKTSQVEKQDSEIEDVISKNSKHHERGRLGLNINNVEKQVISTPINFKHESTTKRTKATTPESLHYFTTAKPKTTKKTKQVDEGDLLQVIENKLDNIFKGVTDFARTSQVEKQNIEMDDVIDTNRRHNKRLKLGFNVNNVESQAISTPTNINHESTTDRSKATTKLHYFTTVKPKTAQKPEKASEKYLLKVIGRKLDHIISNVTHYDQVNVETKHGIKNITRKNKRKGSKTGRHVDKKSLAFKGERTRDQKPAIPSLLEQIVQNDDLWLWLSNNIAKYLEILMARIGESVQEEVDMLLQIYFNTHPCGCGSNNLNPISRNGNKNPDNDKKEPKKDAVPHKHDNGKHKKPGKKEPHANTDTEKKGKDMSKNSKDDSNLPKHNNKQSEQKNNTTEKAKEKSAIYGNSVGNQKVTNVFIFNMRPDGKPVIVSNNSSGSHTIDFNNESSDEKDKSNQEPDKDAPEEDNDDDEESKDVTKAAKKATETAKSSKKHLKDKSKDDDSEDSNDKKAKKHKPNKKHPKEDNSKEASKESEEDDDSEDSKDTKAKKAAKKDKSKKKHDKKNESKEASEESDEDDDTKDSKDTKTKKGVKKDKSKKKHDKKDKSKEASEESDDDDDSKDSKDTKTKKAAKKDKSKKKHDKKDKSKDASEESEEDDDPKDGKDTKTKKGAKKDKPKTKHDKKDNSKEASEESDDDDDSKDSKDTKGKKAVSKDKSKKKHDKKDNSKEASKESDDDDDSKDSKAVKTKKAAKKDKSKKKHDKKDKSKNSSEESDDDDDSKDSKDAKTKKAAKKDKSKKKHDKKDKSKDDSESSEEKDDDSKDKKDAKGKSKDKDKSKKPKKDDKSKDDKKSKNSKTKDSKDKKGKKSKKGSDSGEDSSET